MITELPQDFPSEALAYLLPILRGAIPADKRKAATCGWNVVGYAISIGVPAQSANALPASESQVFSSMESALTSGKEYSRQYAPSIIPWRRLIEILLPLIMQWAS